jgi:hypothetical protein
MSSFTYNGNIPNPPNNPSNDVSTMQTNATSIGNIIAVDHVGFNTSNGGYHTVAHFVPQSVNPPKLSGIGEIFCKTIVSPVNDEVMFWQNGSGNVIQMTMNFVPNATTNGYSFLPGGIIIQWGLVVQSLPSGSSSTFTTNFNIPFPNQPFIVTGNPTYSKANYPSSQGSLNIRASQLSSSSKTSFDWQFYTNSSAYTGFTWLAIGY